MLELFEFKYLHRISSIAASWSRSLIVEVFQKEKTFNTRTTLTKFCDTIFILFLCCCVILPNYHHNLSWSGYQCWKDNGKVLGAGYNGMVVSQNTPIWHFHQRPYNKSPVPKEFARVCQITNIQIDAITLPSVNASKVGAKRL